MARASSVRVDFETRYRFNQLKEKLEKKLGKKMTDNETIKYLIEKEEKELELKEVNEKIVLQEIKSLLQQVNEKVSMLKLESKKTDDYEQKYKLLQAELERYKKYITQDAIKIFSQKLKQDIKDIEKADRKLLNKEKEALIFLFDVLDFYETKGLAATLKYIAQKLNKMPQ